MPLPPAHPPFFLSLPLCSCSPTSSSSLPGLYGANFRSEPRMMVTEFLDKGCLYDYIKVIRGCPPPGAAFTAGDGAGGTNAAERLCGAVYSWR